MTFDLASELIRLANKGYAPMVIYDDNGHWAISDECVSTLHMDDSDSFQASVWCDPAWFRDTPQAAWECYLERLRELGN